MKPLALAVLVLTAAPIPAADYPFTVKVVGQGKPMILIPGLACSGEVWDSTVAHFKDKYECHVLTLAGFAGVPPIKPEKGFFDTMTAGIVAYAGGKKLDRPVLVGHSLGASVALRTAAAAPDRFGVVVMVDGFPATLAVFLPDAPPAEWAKYAAARRDGFAKADRDGFLKQMRDLFGSMLDGEKLDTAMKWVAAGDQATVAKSMGEVFGYDARPEVARVRGPVLILGAFHDGLKTYIPSPEEFEKRLKAQVKGAKDGRVAVHGNCKHFIMYDEPKWMFEQMEKLLGGK
ncbi:MAG TPA: alpha/beta hydrolase [Fimbriiglobus sp.]|nr:alpha/beta hydrolase [Fimbriiglobus sp.]